MEEHSAILLHERYQFEKATFCMIPATPHCRADKTQEAGRDPRFQGLVGKRR